jgi:hypothetical protein
MRTVADTEEIPELPDALYKAIQAQPDPPCDACLHVNDCTAPDNCTPYQIYVELGEVVKPPRELPE